MPLKLSEKAGSYGIMTHNRTIIVKEAYLGPVLPEADFIIEWSEAYPQIWDEARTPRLTRSLQAQYGFPKSHR